MSGELECRDGVLKTYLVSLVSGSLFLRGILIESWQLGLAVHDEATCEGCIMQSWKMK